MSAVWHGRSPSRICRGRDRSREAHFHHETRRTIEKVDSGAMELGDSGDKGKTKPASGRGAARFETVETAEDLRALLSRDSGTVVGNVCNDLALTPPQPEFDCRSLGRMPDGILNKVGCELKEELSVTRNHGASLNFRDKHLSLVLGNSRKRGGNELEELRKIDGCEPRLAGAGLDLCDTEKRGESIEQRLRLSDRRIRRSTKLFRRLRRRSCGFEILA